TNNVPGMFVGDVSVAILNRGILARNKLCVVAVEHKEIKANLRPRVFCREPRLLTHRQKLDAYNNLRSLFANDPRPLEQLHDLAICGLRERRDLLTVGKSCLHPSDTERI